MVDTRHQASGLLGLAAHAPARVVAVAALPQESVGLQLLWFLTRQPWQGEGPTLVLDGHAAESGDPTDRQGLLPQLRLAARQGQGVGLPQEDGLTVWPAHDGVLALCEQARRDGAAVAQRRLMAALPDGALVLLYAPPEMLAVLLMDSDVHPLVALNEQADRPAHSVVTAYNALKVLRHAGSVQPVLVPMRPYHHDEAPGIGRAEHAVRHCYRKHVGETVQSWPVAYHDDCVAGQLSVPESWWLRVLDSALAPEAATLLRSVAVQPLPLAQEMGRRSL